MSSVLGFCPIKRSTLMQVRRLSLCFRPSASDLFSFAQREAATRVSDSRRYGKPCACHNRAPSALFSCCNPNDSLTRVFHAFSHGDSNARVATFSLGPNSTRYLDANSGGLNNPPNLDVKRTLNPAVCTEQPNPLNGGPFALRSRGILMASHFAFNCGWQTPQKLCAEGRRSASGEIAIHFAICLSSTASGGRASTRQAG
jgi:hypothetical protein